MSQTKYKVVVPITSKGLGVGVKVELLLDLGDLATHLGHQALSSKTGTASLSHGAVKARIIKDPK